MVRKLFDWALANPLLILLASAALLVGGGYAYTHATIEAYPDPAPAIIEVVAQFPGASAEEVERQVTVPLEVALAGMPGLETTRSKSLFGLSHIRNQFDYSRDYDQAKQDVINRLASAALPPGVTPQVSPASPVGEILRYTLENPRDPLTGKPVYTLGDLKAVQDYTLQRELLRVPRVAGVTGIGGVVKRYEVQPDPQRLKQYGVTLAQLQAALGNANANGSGDTLTQGPQAVVVRSLGLIGRGRDPVLATLPMADPAAASALLRREEARRCVEVRQVVVASVNAVPVRVDQLVDGGPVLAADGRPRVDDAAVVARGVVVGHQVRQGRAGLSRPLRGRRWDQLTDPERDEVRSLKGWPAPPTPTPFDDLRGRVLGKRPETGDPEASVWWEDELNRWQSRPAKNSTWAELSPEARAAVRAKMKAELPAAEADLGGWRFHDRDGRWDGWDDGKWADDDDVVQGIVLLRKGQPSSPALAAVVAKIDELNAPGHLPPGVRIRTFYNRAALIDKTTDTVHENLLVGMGLVSAILLMFLGNVRAAVIVAINIPLALLFAFGVLFVRGKSANLLSIGAVDFGIIVDSSVIIVESVYRTLTSGENADEPLADRIARACGHVTKSVFFATLVMVCALLPLFTMTGPEGQIFGPMADTYAFALGGALVLAMLLSPVLCLLLMKRLKPKPDNVLVRGLQWLFVAQLKALLWARWAVLALFVAALAFTGVTAARMGREFMPELEEGNLMVRGTFPVNVSLPEVAGRAKTLRQVFQRFPEFAVLVPAIGRPDDGTDPTGYYNVETFIPMRPQEEWPAWIDVDFARLRELEVQKLKPDDARGREVLEKAKSKDGLLAAMKSLGRPVPAAWTGPRPKAELVKALDAALDDHFPGVDFDISQIIRDNVMEALSGVKGENSIKVFGPDLDALEGTARDIRDVLSAVPGVQNPGLFRIQGQGALEFPIDRQKCARWNVSPADVQAVVESAVGGAATTKVQEGEKLFDLTVRWPERLRSDVTGVLEIPVPVANVVTAGGQVVSPTTPVSAGAAGLSPTGTTASLPSATGSLNDAAALATATPTRRLGDLVTPLDPQGRPDAAPNHTALAAAVGGWAAESPASFLRAGASTIYREQGQRLIAVKFEVRGRDLAGTVAEAKEKVEPLLKVPYRAEWSGEFKQMEAAEHRMAQTFLVSLVLIAVLLYLAFRSFLDAAVVFANVLAMGVGGVWALQVVGLNFNISAAVGFISILGVAVMNGLLFVSAFNGRRAKGVELTEAVVTGTRQLVRPVVMTALAAILGLLPAAMSTKMGSESQRPLAVVVVGGMLATILCLNLVPVLYSFYGRRTPPAGAGDMAH